ncbi:magnesium/cobalt transporter CorA [Fluviicola sp.]|jgi:magnesium transporter|uniref:magnesium/cobalt transporter CorA n=1 Tax=Fluviicola sp. TaxID=1917219 RepID=UPI00281E5A2A|nr:magnesium/cobalt transporter CorA [Fluviicola sp.]MDR0801378.1 magnesium/cobalt transporter CorA [Fluviicola sp.]
MIRVFYTHENELVWEKYPEKVVLDPNRNYLWIDLLHASQEEKQHVSDFFQVKLPTYKEAVEIESSSRYSEDAVSIKANSGFLKEEEQPRIHQVSFLLKGNTLFTIRNVELQSFAEVVKKIKVSRQDFIRSGSQIWVLLLETRIDLDADYIESLTRITNVINRKVQSLSDPEEKTLRKIAELQENTILIRESITDKQRLISALMRSPFINHETSEHLRVIMKDVMSLLQHTQFSFERLEYLQDTLMGLVNIEQNKIIKIFTVVSVVFMPPTLIASIYGMNFRAMPELDWDFGYPVAVILMVLSSAFTLYFFKRKKWL